MNFFKRRISRRQLLRGGAIVGAGMLAPWHVGLSKTTDKVGRGGASSPKIEANPPYSGPIPLTVSDISGLLPTGVSPFYTASLVASIPVAKPKSRHGNVKTYEMTFRQTGFSGSPSTPFGTHFKFHPQLSKQTPTWGYDDGQGGYLGYLGPTLEVQQGVRIEVRWINSLPGNVGDPFGLADPNLIPAELQPVGGRGVVHVHGGHNPTQYDGGPENSFPPGQNRLYIYENNQAEATQWYHDHAMGVTRLNAYAGLAAFYINRGLVEQMFNFPSGPYEIPLVLQDKAFFTDGSLLKLWYYKPWNPEFFGNVILVNAQMWPVLHVEPRRYRFRLLNGTQARFFNLRLTTAVPTASAGWGKSADVPFYQIAAEGGFLPNVVVIGGNGVAANNGLTLGNAERADVIVDFSNLNGQSVYLSNDASTPFDPAVPLNANDPDTPTFTGNLHSPSSLDEPVINVMQVMKFVVDVSLNGKDKSFAPAAGKTVNRFFTGLNASSAAQYRQITLVEQPYEPGDVNGDPANRVTVNNRPFSIGGGNITETPGLGTTEVWQFINMTPDTHPMHMHLFTFQVIGRQQLAPALTSPGPDDPEYLKYRYGVDGGGSQIQTTGKIDPKYLTGPVVPPDPNESGFKETVKSPPGWVTYIIEKFTDFNGKFVYHCHILDHEENDMMQYMDVQVLAKQTADSGGKPTEYALEQNYPNPFNPSTTIRFQIPEDSHVQLKVFNGLGQEVETLIDADYPAGTHAINWNASSLASGTYFAKIKAGGYVAAKKMLLMK